MIMKQLRYAAILAMGVIIFTLLIPSDPKNALFMGYSASRLSMAAGFGFLGALFAITAQTMKSQPGLNHRLESNLNQLLERPALKIGLSTTLALMILTGIFHLAQWMMISDEFLRALTLRTLPVSVFAAGLGALGFNLQAMRDMRRGWRNIIVLTISGTAGGILLQGWLLSTIERRYALPALLSLQSQLAAMLAAFALISIFYRLPRGKKMTWGWIMILILVLFVIQWFTLPAKYWRSLRDLALASPSIIFAGSLLTFLIFASWDRMTQTRQRNLQQGFQLIFIAFLLVLIVPYFRSTSTHSQVLNYSAEFVDQKEFLLFAKDAYLTNFKTTGDHNRVPLYPYFLALFYYPEMSDTVFFEVGKTVNVWLTLALLVLIFFFLRKYLSLLNTTLFTAIAAFSIFIFKAAYIQAETVYYFLTLIGFVLALRLLIQPNMKLAAATGVVLGLAHLTKASILPGLLLFTVLFVIKQLIETIRKVRSGSFTRERVRSTFAHLGMLALALTCFLAVIFPYIWAMKQRFGHYFYNVNTTFYVWYDDNFEAIAAEAEHHFTERWPAHIPPDELPSPEKYFREHSLGQILERIKFGIQSQAHNIRTPFSVTNYQLSYLAILGFVFLADLKRSLRLAGQYPYAVAYSILFFLGYLAAYTWYSPIAPERRFTYGLYLPFLFSVFVSLREIGLPKAGNGLGTRSVNVPRLVSAAHLIMFATLLFNIYYVFTERMLFDRYGA